MAAADIRGEINYFRIPVDEDSYSLIQIGSRDFPIHLSFDNLTDYENCFVNWHKQKEIEISIITEGALEVCLPGCSEIFREGDVFVIFPDVLHSIKKVEHTACVYRTLLFAPDFLYGYSRSYWDTAFYQPLIHDKTSIAAFRKTSYGTYLAELHSILEHPTEDMTPLQKMQLQHNLQNIWVKLFTSHHDSRSDQNTETILTDMLLFLHRHYSEKFSLEALAAEVNLSRSECCRKFRKNMDMTMMEYLTEYRVGKAIELLEDSSLSMTEIAGCTGFSSASSFSELFRSKTGLTPLQYRKRNRSKDLLPVFAH